MPRTFNDYSNFHALFQGYGLSDQDAKSDDADITYFGYLNYTGEWYIMRQDSSVGGDSDLQAWRYVRGGGDDPDTVDYATAWAGREALDYDTFQETFK